MRLLKKLLAVASLTGVLAGCYVESHPAYTPTYYSYGYRCRTGYYWDGYRCRWHYY
ncbi:MAG TPA: hypothetical protein VMJ10_09550 [Kofleriaceae bacterium]|nr:hypothetical protein [Kofleriaceae bacterium]